jgi:2-dehydro-3-deoxyphosphooctonate aldolase (KDO 8-P synthase)
MDLHTMKDHLLQKTNNQSIIPFFIIAGPCVIENEKICFSIARQLKQLSSQYSVDIVFKASYDKANRTSKNSFRGPGPQEGLRILEKVHQEFDLPVLTDIHETYQAAEAAQAVQVLQIPAFLCRQTDLLEAAARTGLVVNVKKGQFAAPADMKYSLEKAGENTWITERGTFFGYNRLVVDFAGFPILKSYGKPLIFDATHSVQSPGGGQGCSSGNRDLAIPLAKAAICMGANGLFFEIHPDPDQALCDGPNSISTVTFEKQLPRLLELARSEHQPDIINL